MTEAGYYTWVAYYDSGDGNNVDATHACGQAVETTLVKPAGPGITTEAQQTEVLLSDEATYLSDEATLVGRHCERDRQHQLLAVRPVRHRPGSRLL